MPKCRIHPGYTWSRDDLRGELFPCAACEREEQSRRDYELKEDPDEDDEWFEEDDDDDEWWEEDDDDEE